MRCQRSEEARRAKATEPVLPSVAVQATRVQVSVAVSIVCVTAVRAAQTVPPEQPEVVAVASPVFPTPASVPVFPAAIFAESSRAVSVQSSGTVTPSVRSVNEEGPPVQLDFDADFLGRPASPRRRAERIEYGGYPGGPLQIYGRIAAVVSGDARGTLRERIILVHVAKNIYVVTIMVETVQVLNL